MGGNVWEWTTSDYNKDTKVLRGGSWGYPPTFMRAADRAGIEMLRDEIAGRDGLAVHRRL